ncbi:MAG TPA: ATP-binding protein [Nitriliruptorales bacterium]
MDDALAGVGFFAELDQAARSALAEAATPQRFDAGSAIVREGEPGDRLLVLTAGTARVIVGGRPRRDLGPGAVLGEIALLDGGARSATVYAVDDVDALALTGVQFRAVLDQDPASRYAALVRGMCARLRGLEQDRWAAHEQRRLRELQDLFLANVGHELRTPLTTAMGFLQLATTRDLPEEKLRDVLGSTLLGLRGLHHIVEDLLSLAADERRQERLAADRYPVRVLVDAAAAEVDIDAGRLDVDVPENLSVVGDGHRLTQVLANLVDNAAKFGPDGGRIAVRAAQQDGVVHIDVADEGPGVPVDDRQLIFQLFSQRDPTSTRARGGLGIGLAVARSTARLHGGDLELIEDAPSTTFRLTLPAAD